MDKSGNSNSAGVRKYTIQLFHYATIMHLSTIQWWVRAINWPQYSIPLLLLLPYGHRASGSGGILYLILHSISIAFKDFYFSPRFFFALRFFYLIFFLAACLLPRVWLSNIKSNSPPEPVSNPIPSYLIFFLLIFYLKFCHHFQVYYWRTGGGAKKSRQDRTNMGLITPFHLSLPPSKAIFLWQRIKIKFFPN